MISNEPRHWISTCSEDENGNIILDFPDELLETMGWAEGTELSIEAFAGSIVLREVKT
jgi:hypothetical protein